MLSLRHRLYFIVGINLIIVSQTAIPRGLFFDVLRDFIHFLVFAPSAYLFLGEVARHKRINTTYVIAVIILLTVFGGLIEVVQPYFQRSQSWRDFAYDIAGAVCGALTYLAQHQPRHRAYLSSATATAFIGALLPLAIGAHALWQQKQQLPILMDFEKPALYSLLQWQPEQPKPIQTAPASWNGNQSIVGLLRLTGEGWINLGLKNLPEDWRNFSTLKMELFSPNVTEIPFNIRIVDAQHNWEYNDRFNKNIKLQPGYNLIQIPLSDIANGPVYRQLDLSSIKELLLFAQGRKDNAMLYIDNISLRH